jgi:hypothetical protein
MKDRQWLLLVTNIPGGNNKALRMRVWRALKAAGAQLLRDGVYVLPQCDTTRGLFERQARDVHAGKGSAHVLVAHTDSGQLEQHFARLFDRSAEYQALLDRLFAVLRSSARGRRAEVLRRFVDLQRDARQLMAIDYLPGQARPQLESALAEAAITLANRYSADEPVAAQRNLSRVDPKRYRGRTWATRRNLWIDRVCSAWLIKRFIDQRAKFVWLAQVSDLPKGAVGFDFNGAEFAHIGDRVTFEVLLASFGLEDDPALLRLGALVHFLDIGGIALPEAAGLKVAVEGAKRLHPGDDDALLAAVSPLLDQVHAGFGDDPFSNS